MWWDRDASAVRPSTCFRARTSPAAAPKPPPPCNWHGHCTHHNLRATGTPTAPTMSCAPLALALPSSHSASHLGWPREELPDALEDGICQGLGGKGDDEALLGQAGQVLDHAVDLVLRRGNQAPATGCGGTVSSRRQELDHAVNLDRQGHGGRRVGSTRHCWPRRAAALPLAEALPLTPTPSATADGSTAQCPHTPTAPPLPPTHPSPAAPPSPHPPHRAACQTCG